MNFSSNFLYLKCPEILKFPHAPLSNHNRLTLPVLKRSLLSNVIIITHRIIMKDNTTIINCGQITQDHANDNKWWGQLTFPPLPAVSSAHITEHAHNTCPWESTGNFLTEVFLSSLQRKCSRTTASNPRNLASWSNLYYCGSPYLM